jgi:TonB family protein
MNLRLAAGWLLGLIPSVVLTACSSVPKAGDASGAYWQDQGWDEKLLDSVQAVIHYPIDSAGYPIGRPVSVHGKVEFTYVDGKIADPEMAESTGRPDLDSIMLEQLSGAKLPAAFGPHAGEPHAFQLELTMPSPLEEFSYEQKVAVDRAKVYPKDAILNGAQGVTTVFFDNVGGKAADVHMVKSSGYKSLDMAALEAVKHAQLPSPPNWYVAKPLHFQIAICYSLGNSDLCPAGTRTVIKVDNTTDTQPASPPSGP